MRQRNPEIQRKLEERRQIVTTNSRSNEKKAFTLHVPEVQLFEKFLFFAVYSVCSSSEIVYLYKEVFVVFTSSFCVFTVFSSHKLVFFSLQLLYCKTSINSCVEFADNDIDKKKCLIFKSINCEQIQKDNDKNSTHLKSI